MTRIFVFFLFCFVTNVVGYYVPLTRVTRGEHKTNVWKKSDCDRVTRERKGSSILDLQRVLASLAICTSAATFSSKPTVASFIDSSNLQQGESQVINLFKQNTPSVVFINTFVQRLDAFSMNVMDIPAGTGSGFVWDKKGHIVTNYHVIRNAQSAKVTVTSKDGLSTKTFKAIVKGVDPDKDVAVLTIDGNGWPWKPIELSPKSSSKLQVGQYVLAIGNPFGLDHSLTTGVVSGLNREVRSPSNKPISNVIQTDAAVNPGNSGGPLIDSTGHLIGMNTAIYTMSGGSAGIGFAIPVDTLRYEVDTILTKGRVVRPTIGISYLQSSQAQNLGIRGGILVLDLGPEGSPARLSGLRGTNRNTETGRLELGDIIVGMNGDTIRDESDLFKLLEKKAVGEEITLKVLRWDPLKMNRMLDGADTKADMGTDEGDKAEDEIGDSRGALPSVRTPISEKGEVLNIKLKLS